MEQHHMPAFLYRLRNIVRWSLMRNTQADSVAVHSYYVSVWAHLLCTIGNEIFGKSLPVDRVVSMALFHDATEVFVGDVAQPVKHSSPEILRLFRQIETEAGERLVGMLPESLQEVYRPLIVEHDPILYRYVKGADLLDAYLKCVSELSAGNQEFSVAQKHIEAALRQLRMEEVDYFLDHMAPSFTMTIDELSEHKDESHSSG